jgi:hypothetical protein
LGRTDYMLSKQYYSLGYLYRHLALGLFDKPCAD